MTEIDWQLRGAQLVAGDIRRYTEAAIELDREDIMALMVEALEKALAKLTGARGQS